MKSKITCFICLIVFVIINVGCGVNAIDPPLRPIVPNEQITGVFQSDDNNIVSLNNDWEYMMVGIFTGGRYITGQYSINELGFLELYGETVPIGYNHFQIRRQSLSTEVNMLVPLNRNPFISIMGQDRYNIALPNGGVDFRYIGIGSNGQGYSLNLSLSRFRIAEFVLPRNPSEIIYGAYCRSFTYSADDIHFTSSTRDFGNFRIRRNTRGEISNLIYNPHETEENQILLIRENLVYTADELTVLINNIVGSRFRLILRGGRSFNFSLERYLITCPSLFIEGESELRINLTRLRPLIEYLNEIGLSYIENQLIFRAEIRNGSRTEITSFYSIMAYTYGSNILNMMKINNDEL